MKVFIEIEKIEKAQATATDGTGNWGVKMGNPRSKIAWQCPMIGNGGESGRSEALTELLAQYVNTAELDVEDGPDEIIFRNGANYYLMTITAE